MQDVMSTRDKQFRLIDGGRETLERNVLRAILLGLPEADELTRRLAPSANTCLYVVSIRSSAVAESGHADV